MGEILDRRARKKARTRAEIRAVAQRLFAARGFDAVTIADIAAEADVAVQTVFNHFPTKEDLFFDGRTPWVEGPAEAVRSRPATVPALQAVREYLVEMVADRVAAHADDERRGYIATIEASPALRARERELVHESERLLGEALAGAWAAEGVERVGPLDPATAAAVTAATWMAVVRVLLVSQRPALGDTATAARTAATIESVVGKLLADLEQRVDQVHGAAGGGAASVTGWPGDIRRAG